MVKENFDKENRKLKIRERLSRSSWPKNPFESCATTLNAISRLMKKKIEKKRSSKIPLKEKKVRNQGAIWNIEGILLFVEVEVDIVKVIVDFVGCSKLFEAFWVNIEEVGGKGNGFPSEVRENSKGCDRSMEYRSVEFAKYIGTSIVLSDYDEGA
jgi:hypothetical protein